MAGISTGPMAGQTVLVTGGTGGIGKATTTGLAAMGARVGTLGSTQSAAYPIHDNGQIVASGSNAQDQEHAFLLIQLVSAPRIYRPPA
jgi:NAD(P)-dependent dehydrogenase (short-subunit alcohol dehydrogenase family)